MEQRQGNSQTDKQIIKIFKSQTEWLHESLIYFQHQHRKQWHTLSIEQIWKTYNIEDKSPGRSVMTLMFDIITLFLEHRNKLFLPLRAVITQSLKAPPKPEDPVVLTRNEQLELDVKNKLALSTRKVELVPYTTLMTEWATFIVKKMRRTNVFFKMGDVTPRFHQLCPEDCHYTAQMAPIIHALEHCFWNWIVQPDQSNTLNVRIKFLNHIEEEHALNQINLLPLLENQPSLIAFRAKLLDIINSAHGFQTFTFWYGLDNESELQVDEELEDLDHKDIAAVLHAEAKQAEAAKMKAYILKFIKGLAKKEWVGVYAGHVKDKPKYYFPPGASDIITNFINVGSFS